MNGVDLQVGTVLPIANNIAIKPEMINAEFDLKSVLSPSEYTYGSEVEKALNTMRSADSNGERHWFQHNQGSVFTVPYSRSDSFREAFSKGHNMTATEILPGFVYPRHTSGKVSQIPATISLTKEFGFFCGAYLAEGMANATQVNISNNDLAYIKPVAELMAKWSVGTHIVTEDRICEKTGIKGTSTSLIIHSTLLAKVMTETFGRLSYMKTIPDWVFQAPDAFVEGLVDGYISGDGTICKKTGTIHATSVSQDLLTRFSFLLSRYGIFSRISDHMPALGKFQSVSRNWTLHIPVLYSKLFAETFTLTLQSKQDRLFDQFGDPSDVRNCKNDTTNDVVWDKVKEIKEIKPMKDGWMYDLTVAETRNFTSLNGLCVKDTFHLAGVAAKSAGTRGIPRLKELLKATRNPKSSSLTVYLRPEIRKSKEEARRVSQELEFTLLMDIVKVARIYFDPRDSSTIIGADQEWLSFFMAYEEISAPAPVGTEANAIASTNEETDAGGQAKSPWILRFELDRDKMFLKNITMEDVMYVISRRYDNIETAYTDYNADELVIRMRLSLKNKDPMDDLIALKKFQSNILTNTLVRGITGLRAVTFSVVKDYYELVNNRYEKIEQFVLDTDGTNFLDVACHPDIDCTKLYSNNIHDIYANLGVEATRAVLLKEISGLFEDNNVNFRRFGLLCDVICSKGKLMTVDRYGINKNNIGPLAKASFEQTEDIMLRAALFGELDPVTGVSANIMTGQRIRGGTSFSTVLLDEDSLRKFTSESIGVDLTVEREEEFTEEDQDNALYHARTQGKKDDACAIPRLRLEATIPEQKEVSTEYTDMEITFVDE